MKLRGLGQVLLNWLPWNRKIARLESACEALGASRKNLEDERSILENKCNKLTKELDESKVRLQLCRIHNDSLKNAVLELQQTVAKLRASSNQSGSEPQTKRPEWTKQLDVNDLFANATTEDAKARRFRELSKIYHPDLLGSESGFENLIRHLRDEHPQWLRCACYETYLLVMNKKGNR